MVDILERHPSIGLVMGLDAEPVELDEDDKEVDEKSVWYRLVRLAALPSRFMLCHVDIFLGGAFKTGDEKMSGLAQSLQTRVAFAAALLPNVAIKIQKADETKEPSGPGTGNPTEPNIQGADGGGNSPDTGTARAR